MGRVTTAECWQWVSHGRDGTILEDAWTKTRLEKGISVPESQVGACVKRSAVQYSPPPSRAYWIGHLQGVPAARSGPAGASMIPAPALNLREGTYSNVSQSQPKVRQCTCTHTGGWQARRASMDDGKEPAIVPCAHMASTRPSAAQMPLISAAYVKCVHTPAIL